MTRIAKTLLSVLIQLCVIFVIIFGFCWYYDGFPAAWAVFFGSDSLSNILSFVGIYDWLVSIVVALIVAGIIERFIGCRIKAKTARIIVDFASSFVSFWGMLMLFGKV